MHVETETEDTKAHTKRENEISINNRETPHSTLSLSRASRAGTWPFSTHETCSTQKTTHHPYTLTTLHFALWAEATHPPWTPVNSTATIQPSLLLVVVGTGLLEHLDIGQRHLLDERVKVDLALPAELFLRLGRVAVQELDLGGTVVARVDADERLARLGALADFLLVLAFPPIY